MMDDVGEEATTEAIPIPNVGHLEALWGLVSAKLTAMLGQRAGVEEGDRMVYSSP